ncbi:MAG: hypothetical protein WCS99_21005 [Limisphaerales bacterium]
MDEIPEKIPELQFDVIARLVPGAAVLGIYTIHDNKLSEGLGTLFFGIVFSYLLGYLLELTSATLIEYHFLNSFLIKRFNADPSKLASAGLRWAYRSKLASDGQLWEHCHKKTGPERHVFLKMLAERALFRSLALASCVALAFPPDCVAGMWWPAACILVVSLNAYYWTSRFLSNRLPKPQ